MFDTTVLASTFVLAADASSIVSKIQAFVGPILLLAIGIIAIKHLMTRQMTQFFQFMALAVLVLLLFYTPGVLLAVVNLINGFFGDSATSITPSTGSQFAPTL